MHGCFHDLFVNEGDVDIDLEPEKVDNFLHIL